MRVVLGRVQKECTQPADKWHALSPNLLTTATHSPQHAEIKHLDPRGQERSRKLEDMLIVVADLGVEDLHTCAQASAGQS
eukprot:1403242-Rhodomonas_salina.1